MRQDVMHGLFTIYLVVNFTDSLMEPQDLIRLVERISAETNLRLYLDKYFPVPRNPDMRNILMILIGSDRTGIIAAVSENLSRYNINIEFSRTIARSGIFLMELLADISRSSLPVENLERELKEIMGNMKINTLFQTEDVFNKKKRVILFRIRRSFIDAGILREIVNQADIRTEMQEMMEAGSESFLRQAVSRINNLPYDVLNSIVQAVKISPSTIELMQTLKVMGYKIALSSNSFSCFTDLLRQRLGLDYSYGFELSVDSDSKTVAGEMSPADFKAAADAFDHERIFAELIRKESVAGEDITVIDDGEFDLPGIPGFQVFFEMKLVLDYLNQHILNRENLPGILGGFGIPPEI
jgi:phosphoserine phosphatase/predicted amino acid-binding ACT domain protein